MIYICHICHIGHVIYHHNIQILYDVCIIQPYLAKVFLQFGPRLHLSSFPSFTFSRINSDRAKVEHLTEAP